MKLTAAQNRAREATVEGLIKRMRLWATPGRWPKESLDDDLKKAADALEAVYNGLGEEGELTFTEDAVYVATKVPSSWGPGHVGIRLKDGDKIRKAIQQFAAAKDGGKNG